MAPAWEAGAWAGRRLLDLVLPPRELLGGGAALSTGVDAATWSRIAFLEAPVCDGCGAPFPYAGDMQRCTACLARPRLFSRARAACTYDEASRDLILKLKHADRTDLAGLMSAWLSRAAADLVADCDAIIPTPLHPWRLFRRRYNQAAEIGRPLAVRAGKPFLPDTLVRVKPGGQGGKSASGRRRAVQGAFAVSPQKRDMVANKRVLLVDDVMTTGATAEACTRALLRAGVRAVDVAVVARVAEPGG